MLPVTVYSVSQVTGYIKAILDDDEVLGDVWLTGEVSNFKQATSGHCYFTLKDAASSIRAVMWRAYAHGLTLPREGDAVLVHGYVSVYESRGDYQLYVDHVQPGGVGWLWQEYQRLKEHLAAEGLFDEDRKRPIPTLPARIGVVTSPSGAALHDILRTIQTRCPFVEILLAGAAVQGSEAPDSIVAAIAALNQWAQACQPVDAIIVARGGGSIEELWAFNDERVARAIGASAVPVISGVGHETDFTIADFVADLRAATPTAAAAAAVPDVAQLADRVADLAGRAQAEMLSRLAGLRADWSDLDGRLARQSPQGRIDQDRQRADDLQRRALRAMDHHLGTWRERLVGRELLLAGLDPRRVLARGYAIVSTDGGQAVVSRSQVSPGDAIRIRVEDGAFGAQVADTGADTGADGDDPAGPDTAPPA